MGAPLSVCTDVVKCPTAETSASVMARDRYNNCASSVLLGLSCFFAYTCQTKANTTWCIFFAATGLAVVTLELPRMIQAHFVMCCATELQDQDTEFPSASPVGVCGLRRIRPSPGVRAMAYCALLLFAVSMAGSRRLGLIESCSIGLLLSERTLFYGLKWRAERKLYSSLDHPGAVYDHLDTFSVELTPIEVQCLDSSPKYSIEAEFSKVGGHADDEDL